MKAEIQRLMSPVVTVDSEITLLIQYVDMACLRLASIILTTMFFQADLVI